MGSRDILEETSVQEKKFVDIEIPLLHEAQQEVRDSEAR